MDRKAPAYHCILIAGLPKATLRLLAGNDNAAVAIAAELWEHFPDCSYMEIRDGGRLVYTRWRDPTARRQERQAS